VRVKKARQKTKLRDQSAKVVAKVSEKKNAEETMEVAKQTRPTPTIPNLRGDESCYFGDSDGKKRTVAPGRSRMIKSISQNSLVKSISSTSLRNLVAGALPNNKEKSNDDAANKPRCRRTRSPTLETLEKKGKQYRPRTGSVVPSTAEKTTAATKKKANAARYRPRSQTLETLEQQGTQFRPRHDNSLGMALE